MRKAFPFSSRRPRNQEALFAQSSQMPSYSTRAAVMVKPSTATPSTALARAALPVVKTVGCFSALSDSILQFFRSHRGTDSLARAASSSPFPGARTPSRTGRPYENCRVGEDASRAQGGEVPCRPRLFRRESCRRLFSLHEGKARMAGRSGKGQCILFPFRKEGIRTIDSAPTRFPPQTEGGFTKPVTEE